MSSKRGRKRNDNLPPNRARDVQRAFRARRAAHLEALEQRVTELEEENNTLRAALSLPPANRPPLGKGPTGKDKPKSMSSRPQPVEPMPSSSSMAPVNGLPQLSSLNMPPGSRTDSPSSNSTRTHSLSPSTMAAALNSNGQPQPVVNVDSGSWEDNLFGARDRSDVQPSPISTSYPVTPVSSTASQPSYQYPNPVASGSRAAVNQQYALSLPQNYTHSSDRPMGDSYTDSLFDRRFPFPQSPFQTSHDSAQPQLHAQSPTSAVSMPPQRGNANMQPPVNYAHRRSITEPQTLRSVLLNQVPAMAHLQQHSPLQTAEFDLNSRGGRMPSLPS